MNPNNRASRKVQAAEMQTLEPSFSLALVDAHYEPLTLWCEVNNNYYLCQGGYVFVVVCLFVSNFAQKLTNGFA